jgi:peptidyl-prolyl cis-trans isomerase SurA
MHGRFNGSEMKHLRAKHWSFDSNPRRNAFGPPGRSLTLKRSMTFFPDIARGLAVALLAATVLPLASLAQTQNRSVVDEIVAVVGEQIILRSEVDAVVRNVMQQQRLTYADELWAQALNELIDQNVLVAHALRDTTIRVTEEQVDQALNSRIQQMQQQVGGQARLEEIYGKSVVEIRAELRDDFRERMKADQFQNSRMRRVRITPSEVEAWFSQFPQDSLPVLPETVRLAHIVRYPKVSEGARRDAYDMITTIRDSITTGTSTFESMAERFSDDRGSAREGGRLQDFNLRDLVPEFAAMASRIEIGEVSQPFETQFGVHILRVNSRRGDVVDLNHVLIRIDDRQSDPAEALAYLAAVRDSIVTHNIPFEAIARRHSEEDFTSARGGRLVDPRTGERDLFLESLGPTWRRTLARLEPGQISEPVEVELLDGRRAFHIVLLQRRVPEHRVDIRTDYERIEQLALQDKRQRVFREWIDGLRQQVFIDIRGKAQQMAHLLD